MTAAVTTQCDPSLGTSYSRGLTTASWTSLWHRKYNPSTQETHSTSGRSGIVIYLRSGAVTPERTAQPPWKTRKRTNTRTIKMPIAAYMIQPANASGFDIGWLGGLPRSTER